MPHAPNRKNAFYVRCLMRFFRRRLLAIDGNLQQLCPQHDPQVFVFNHSMRIEAVLAPAVLAFSRRGKLVHFMADWQFLMVPIVRDIYRSGQSIIVTTKSAKPKFLNFMKPKEEGSAFDRAVKLLQGGSSIGLFPEAVMNRDPNNLLRGMPGAAKMAVQTGAQVVPIGIRFPELTGNQPIPDNARMSFYVGQPLQPPPASPDAPRQFHADIMTALEQYSGKSWHPDASRRRRYVL